MSPGLALGLLCLFGIPTTDLDLATVKRFVYKGRSFIRIPWRKEVPSFSPTPHERRRGYVVFVPSEFDGISLVRKPQREEVRMEVSAFATPGEYEPLTFALHALKDLHGVKVLLSPLRGEGGERISQEALDLRFVRCWAQRTTWNASTFYVIPELLEHFKALDIPAGLTKQFWIMVHVPEDARPGLYEGEARVEPENAPPVTVKLRLRVLPFRLLKPRGKIWGLYSDCGRWRRMPL